MRTIADTLPPRLRAIYDAVHHAPPDQHTLDSLRAMWAAYIDRASREIRDLHVEAGGEVVYLGALSPGCRACKDGTWDCVFTTMRCNLNCAFCCSPHAIAPDYTGSAFGATPEEITANYARTHITGISFSGGDPFTDTERLFDWIARFKQRRPDEYYWLYTNGLLATEEHVRRLTVLGIDEIRFNLAATGYDHPTVLQNLATAAHYIPTITVEIPVIPKDADKLLSCLVEWCTRGVRFLNLHELLYEPGSNAATLPGTRLAVITGDGHRTAIDPESRMITLAVMQAVQREGLPLAVNDCSLQSKLRQLRGRRRCLAPLVQVPYETLHDDAVYESYVAFRGADLHFFAPDALGEMRQQYPDYRFVRLVRTAPMSIYDEGQWIVFEEI
jgi:pyruvate formate-lyase activating enzyme-like uncharacterized protein